MRSFFRAPTVRDWRKLDRAARIEAEAFCRERVERIAIALKPQRIVVIGLGTFAMLVRESGVALRDGARVLAKSGELWGLPATGIMHLSGARVSRSDLDRLTVFLAENSN